MIRSLLRLGGALAFAACVVPITPSAAPAPGLAYDEIVRVVVGATPPPPGNFQADVASLTSANTAALASPTPAPHRGIGLGNIAKAVLNGGGVGDMAGSIASDAAANAMDNALERSLGAQFAALDASIRGFLRPHLMRYAYYNGWEREDDVTANTATIRKCDLARVYKLDLARKTYSVYDPASEPTPAAAPPPPPARSQRPQRSGTPAPPGTAVVDLSATTKALGPLKIDNMNTSGYATTAAVATTQATGSCRNGSASVTTQDYYSALTRPAVTSCPVRRAPVPVSANDVAAPPQPTGGCQPTLTFHSSGPKPPAGKLSLYTLVTMNASGPSPAPAASPGLGAVGFLTERGNLKTVGASQAALFSVPSDFTKVP